MYEYLKTIPLIDTHVHRVHPDHAPEFGNIAGGYIPGPDQEAHSRQTLLYGMIMERLRRLYGMPEGTPFQTVEKERHRRFNEDPQGYMQELYSLDNVAMYCFEIGSPLRKKAFTQEEVAYFNSVIPPEKRCCIVRIERSVDETLALHLPYDAFLDQFQKDLCARVEKENAIGLKSSIAYYGGLNYSFVSDAESRAAYERIRFGSFTPEEEKKLYAYTLMLAAEIAVRYDIPIQIHTGVGGGSYLDFKNLDPMGLKDFLWDSRILNRVKIILLHGGHPYEASASFLTAEFSNVYTDCSGTFFLSTLNGASSFRTLLERTPLDKVMYGSDGVMFPETSWFAAEHFRKMMAKVMTQLVEEEFLSAGRAEEICRMILFENARNCYTKLRQRLPDLEEALELQKDRRHPAAPGHTPDHPRTAEPYRAGAGI